MNLKALLLILLAWPALGCAAMAADCVPWILPVPPAEQSNYFWFLERSLDGAHWETVASCNGEECLDWKETNAIAFFRLCGVPNAEIVYHTQNLPSP